MNTKTLSPEYVTALKALGFKGHPLESACMTLRGKDKVHVIVGFLYIDGSERLSIHYHDYGRDITLVTRVPDTTSPEDLVSWYQNTVTLAKSSPAKKPETSADNYGLDRKMI